MHSPLRWLLAIGFFAFTLLAFLMEPAYSVIVAAAGAASFLCMVVVVGHLSRRMENAIAAERQINAELARELAASQSENIQRTQILANVSHELRTPLNAIIGFSELIRSERAGPLGSRIYIEYIQDIYSSGVYLLSLINDILDYSKAEANKLNIDLEDVDAAKMIRTCVRLVTPRAEDASVALIEEINQKDFVLKTDARKLKQIILNLLSNAVKFTPSDGSVTVGINENNEMMRIYVTDTGIGIAPKDIPLALSPFGRIDNTLSRKFEGTGLGLPLTKKFVEALGGRFEIESQVGKGTTISIHLPKQKQESAS